MSVKGRLRHSTAAMQYFPTFNLISNDVVGLALSFRTSPVSGSSQIFLGLLQDVVGKKSMNNIHCINKRRVHIRIHHCGMISSKTRCKTLFQSVSDDRAAKPMRHTPGRSPLLSASLPPFDFADRSVVLMLHCW